MPSKTVTIREEVYEKLSRLKENKSFSELLEELVEERKVILEDSFGAWDDEEAAKARKNLEEFKESFGRDFSEQVES